MLRKILAVLAVSIMSVGMAFAAININTATEQELQALPGVGPVKAKEIVDYRKTNGNFKAIEDIKKVKGIGDKMFDKLKSNIAVSGVTAVESSPAKGKKEDPKAAQSANKADMKSNKKK